KARGITVCDSGGSPIAPAELTWTLILASLREFVPEVEAARAGKWQRHLGRAVAGKRLGLVGFGKIAQRVARYAKAFDVEVHVWGRQASLERGTYERYLGDAFEAVNAFAAGAPVRVVA